MALVAFQSQACIARDAFQFDCRSFLRDYGVINRSEYENAAPSLFADEPNFTATDEADQSLLAPFVFDNVKDSSGEMQCTKTGKLDTLRISYSFGNGDFSVERATVVVRVFLADFKRGDRKWSDLQFKRMSAEAFHDLRTKQVRGDDDPFGKSDVDFDSHYAGRLVVTPAQMTFSVGRY